jgi:Cof subfamily protein (haloacid dehalogenase superfamily)
MLLRIRFFASIQALTSMSGLIEPSPTGYSSIDSMSLCSLSPTASASGFLENLVALPFSPKEKYMSIIHCQLAAIDLDGTLLDNQYQLSEENCQTVQKLAESRVIVVLASGRMHATILPFSRRMHLNDPIISYNGAMAKHVKTGETLHHIPIPCHLAEEIIEYCAMRNLHLNFYLDDVLYVREQNEWSKLYDSRTGAISHPVGDLHRLMRRMRKNERENRVFALRFSHSGFRTPEPTKLQIVDAPQNIDRFLIEFKNLFKEKLYITKTQPEYLEFMNPEVSKGRALIAVAKKLGVSMEKVVAFGDGYNDISLMEVAGFRVAMGNSIDEIKTSADYITGTNNEDGVATAIKALLL